MDPFPRGCGGRRARGVRAVLASPKKLGGEPFALLVTSIRRSAIDLGRQQSRRTHRENVQAESDVVLPLFESLNDSLADERRALIEQVIQALPFEQRQVLVLKIWGELTFEQIAAQLEISPNTAASRYRYALTALRHQLTAADCHG